MTGNKAGREAPSSGTVPGRYTSTATGSRSIASPMLARRTLNRRGPGGDLAKPNEPQQKIGIPA